ncbi:hypothetical protein C1752_00988 [Acaryochloris thomasi RCC1774]|uniref:MOSC domain-containing protein n=1 Tax=Acaryochloris thomasi RCC1774 TaxID=1764569 RepID=A0A2W1JNC0_9CYAN|nr:MOSC domain-containing protein [Acaryochloris thomasi]PZD74716.1 hypothetical protein C1752_00988 [Acaryochloris thomasi RCC1774]
MIRNIYRYPVKGLSGEELATVTLLEGRGMPLDRRFAIARSPDVFDPDHPVAKPKGQFLMLMRDEGLALLNTRFDDASGRLSIEQDGIEKLNVSLDDANDRSRLAQFLKIHLRVDKIEPVVVSATDHKFTDISVVSPQKMNAVSLINLSSVKALGAAIGQDIDHRRFRANFYFDGVEPWSEFDWMDKDITLGGTRLRVTMRTKRCPATQVNPETAQRDIDVPRELKHHFGHSDIGVYAEVIEGGEVSVGAPLSF